MALYIFIAVAVLVVIGVVNNIIRARTCPQCGHWRKTEVTRLDSSNMLMEDSAHHRTVINVCRCKNCGKQWEERIQESTD